MKGNSAVIEVKLQLWDRDYSITSRAARVSELTVEQAELFNDVSIEIRFSDFCRVSFKIHVPTAHLDWGRHACSNRDGISGIGLTARNMRIHCLESWRAGVEGRGLCLDTSTRYNGKS